MRRRRSAAWCVALASWLSGATGLAQPGAPPDIAPPVLLDAPALVLPAGAAPLGRDASVLLELTIDREGAVSAVRIVEPLRDDVDALVLDAARAMRFAPATREGEPIPARIQFRYRVEPPAGEPSEDEPAEGEPAEDEPAEDASVPAEPEVLGVTAVVERNQEEGAGGRITLRGVELTTVPGTFGEPLRAVASLPGVARSPFGLGFFLVRGSDFQNTGFLVDGFQVPILYHLGAGPAILHSRLVDQMHFYSGNYPVRYGRFGGGLIALETSVPALENPLGEISIDAARASVFAAVPFENGRGAVAASFRRSYFELILPFVQPGIDLSYTDYQVLAQYRVDRRLSISVFAFGADDRLDQSGQIGDGGFLSEGSRSAASFDLQRLIATLRIELSDGARLRISGMIGRDASGFDTAQPGFGLLRFELEAFFAGWRAEIELPMSRELRARVGVDLSTLNARILGTAPVPPGLGELPRPLPSVQTSDASLAVVEAFAAAYYEQIIDVAPVEVSAGLRIDILRYGDVLTPIFDPRVVARVRLHPMLVLKAASGLFVQQPSPFTIFRVGGNPSVSPERSWQSSAGLELTLPPGIEAWLTGFYNRQWNIARGADAIVPAGDGLRRVFFSDDGEGQAFGLEAMLRLRIEGFYGWLTYTLSRSERWSPDTPATLFAFDQTHVVNLVASYGFDGWRFGLRFSLASGRPVPGITGTRLDADTGGYLAQREGQGERLPISHQLDVRIDRDFEIGPVRGSVFLDVANVYFSDLPEGQIYQYDYQRSALLRGLPIIPTLGVRGTLE